MAEAKNVKNQQKKPSAPAMEEKYDVAEFASAADRLFGTAPECVIAAFSCEGVTKATKEEAERIVSAFLKKEVKR